MVDLLDLYSPSFVHPVFHASDFGLRKAPVTPPPITARYDNHPHHFIRPEFVKFFKLLLPQSQYGAWQLDRAQKWNKEDWRLFVAAKLYVGLVEYDNHKDAFGWQRESAEMATVLEALLTADDAHNEEVGYRLRKRLAVLLSHRFPTIEDDAKALYKQRSAFVHGSFFAGLAKKSTLTDGDPPVPDFGLLHEHKEHVRHLLVAYLALAKAFPSRKDIFGEKGNVMGALEDAVIDIDLRGQLIRVADEALSLLPPKGEHSWQ